MKPWFLLFIFFPLWATEVDLPHQSYNEVLHMLQDQRDEVYVRLEERLDMLFQSLIIIDSCMCMYPSHQLKKEYKQLKKEFLIIAKALKKLKGQ